MTRNPLVNNSHFREKSALLTHFEGDQEAEIRRKLKPVIDLSASAMLVLDAESTSIIAANSSFYELTGYSEENILKRSLLSLLSRDGAKVLLPHPEVADKTDFHQQGIFQLTTSTGGILHVQAASFPQKLEGCELIYLNLTGLPKPQKEGEATEEADSMIDSIDSYLWSLDSNLKVRRVNRAAQRMFRKGFNRVLKTGDDFNELLKHEAYHAKDLWRTRINEVLENGSSASFIVSETFNGSFMHIEVRVQPVFKEGKVDGINCHVVNKTSEYQRHRLIEVLDEFKTRILEVDDIDRLMWLAMDDVLARLSFEDALILLVEGDNLIAKAAHGAQRIGDKNEVWPLKLNIGEGITGTVAQTGEAEIVNDTTLDERYYSHHFLGHSEVAVPILVDNKVFGVINCESRQPGFFMPSHLEMLKEVTELLATKIRMITSDQELRRMESLNHTLLDATPTSFFLIDADGNVQSFNRAAASIFNSYFNTDLAVGLNFCDYLSGKYLSAFRSAIIKALEGGLYKVEREFVHPELGRVWFAFTFAPAYGREKEVFGVAFTIEVITDKKLQENLIIQQNKELRKTNQELDKFVYSVSHDLRSPITNVLGLSTLLDATDSMKQVREYTSMIKGAMYRMDDLIHNILDYSRNNRLELSCEGISLHQLVEEVIMDHCHIDVFQSISIENLVHQEQIIKSDPQRLKIILNNLVSNAIKYHDDEKEEKFVKISSEKHGNTTLLRVSDNGQGIDEKHFPHLHKMFYTANLRAKGSGIGLYILNDAVSQLNGKVVLKSVPGKGTIFTVSLPDLTPSCND